MRFLPWLILAYVVLGLQIGLGDYASYHGAAPNLVLLAVVFVALHAPRDAALLGAFGTGLLQDLTGQSPLGLHALAYGLVALFVINTQQVVYREHPLTHFAAALVGGLITATILLLHGWVHPPGPAIADGAVALPAVRGSALTPFTTALYTALLAPIVLWLLARTRRVFAFESGRRRGR